MKNADIQPGKTLNNKVKAGFIEQGTTLAEWCRRNGITPEWACQALTGKRKGKAVITLCQKLLAASMQTFVKPE